MALVKNDSTLGTPGVSTNLGEEIKQQNINRQETSAFNKGLKEEGISFDPTSQVADTSGYYQAKNAYNQYLKDYAAYEANLANTASLSFDKKSGKITVNAPSMALKNKAFKDRMSEILSAITQNYKLNKDYKYALLSNSDETKTSEEWVKHIEKDLPTYVNEAMTKERIKRSVKESSGVDLSDDDTIKMSTIALDYKKSDGTTEKVTDNTMQSLPARIKNLNVFKNLEGWDENSHVVSWGNLKKQWDREVNSDEDILKAFDVVDKYFSDGDFSDPSEYAEMVAFSEFINGKDPDVGFWRNTVETVGEGMLNVITGAAEFDAGLMESLFGDSTVSKELRNWVDERRKDTANLSDVRAAVGSVTHAITPIAMELAVSVAAGNTLANLAKKAGSALGAVDSMIATTASKYATSAEELANTTQIVGMMGKAGTMGDAIAGARGIAKSLYVGTEISLKLMDASKAAQVIGNSFRLTAQLTHVAPILGGIGKVLSKTSALADVLGQVIVDVTLSDPSLFRKLIESDDDEAKGYALEQLSMNVFGEVAGVSAGKWIKNLGSSDVGLVLQAKSAPIISGIKAHVGQTADNIKAILRGGGDSDWIYKRAERLGEEADKMANESSIASRLAWNRASKAESQALNVTERRVLREANREISKLAGTVKGDTWEETLEAARNVKGKMAETLAEANNIINYMYTRDITATVRKIMMDSPKLSAASSSYTDALTRVLKAEDAAGLSGKASRKIKIEGENVFGTLSRETNEYILGQYRIETAKAVVEKSTVQADVLGAKKELEYYTKAVESFRANQPAELVEAADELLARAKSLSGLTQDVRVGYGVMAQEHLDKLRTSGYFDGGYIRTQRAKTWVNYRSQGGSLKITDPRAMQELGWGFSGDAPEAFQDVSLVLFDDINEVARQVNRKKTVDMLKGVGYKIETVVGEESTRVASEINKKAVSTAAKAVEDSTAKAVSSSDSAIFNDFFRKKVAAHAVSQAISDEAVATLKEAAAEAKVLKKVTKAERARAFRTVEMGVIDDIVLSDPRSAFNIPVVDDESLLKFRSALDPKSRAMLDDMMVSSIGDAIPVYKTGNKATDKALELRADILKGKVRKMNKKEIEQVYTLEHFMNAENDNLGFIGNLKRQYAERNFKNSLDEIILSAKEEDNLFRAKTIHKESKAKLEDIRKKFDIPDFDIRVQEDLEDFIDGVVDANMRSEVFADVVGTLEDMRSSASELAEYTTMQSMWKNKKQLENNFYDAAKKQYTELLRKEMKSRYPKKADAAILARKLRDADKMAGQWADEVSRMLVDRIEQRYGEIANTLMQKGSALISEEAKRDIFSHIADINKEITEASKAGNVIKTYGARGYEEFVEVSPTVANMFTTMPRSLRRGTFGEIQQGFTRAFRFGTTGGLVPGSLVNQAFRDYGNTIVMGGALRGNDVVEKELADLFGEQFAKFYKEQVPDVFDTLLKESKETGEDVNRLIARREMQFGAANIDSELEKNIYQFGREARAARMSRGVYDTTWSERFTDVLDKAQEKAEFLNTTRESYLRKRNYNNALLDSLKQGLSIQDSRRVAEFVQSEATTNFVRRSYHLANLTKTVPYLGSAINGTKSFWRLASWDPFGVATRIIGGYVVPVIALTNMTLANEEDRRIYKQIPEYQKAEHITFVLGGQIISIPVPQEISNFVTPVQHMIESLQGVSDHSFGDLMANDLLGAFPIELDGFMNIDADYLQGNIFEDHLLPGFSKVSSSLMPPLVKSGFMMATGVDPYTMKKIDRTNLSVDQDTGEQIVIDYRTGEFAKFWGTILGGFISAPMAQRVLENLIGKGGTLWADSLIELGQSVVSEDKDFWNDGVAKIGQKLTESALERVSVARYGEESNLAWNRAVAQLWETKEAILNDAGYKKDMQALGQKDLSEDARKAVESRVRSKQQEFMQKVLDTANALNAKYEGTFDRNKFASVLSLVNMDMNSTNYNPFNSYSTYLSKQEYQVNKAAAIETMAKMGFSGPEDGSIFGYYAEDSDGNITIRYNSPINVLNFETSVDYQSKIAAADIRAVISKNDLYAGKQAIKNQLDAIYNKKKLTKADYAKIEQIQINWNARVAEAVAPVVSKMTPEAAINNTEVKNLLRGYLYVPSSYAKNDKGRYVSLGKNGSKSDAYYESWIKRMFKINDKYKGQY